MPDDQSAPTASSVTPTKTFRGMLFVHIPKTGGIALYSALESFFGREQSTRFAHGGDGADASADALRRYRLISGHEPFPAFLAKGLGDYFAVTVVREPVGRLISVYHYVRSLPEHPLHAEYMAMRPEDWVVKIEQGEERSQQIWQLGGSYRFHEAKPMLDRLHLLIPYDRLDEGAQRLSTILRTPLALERLNETDKSNATPFSDEQRERIRVAMAEEFELLDYARGRWAADA